MASFDGSIPTLALVAGLLIETADANGSTLLIATHDARLRKYVATTIQIAPLVLAG